MPAKDFSQPVFQADANAATDWGSVGAGGAVDFRATADLGRGIDLELGLMAIANLDASFSKFLAADLQGSAQAQASVRAQIELPLNLFDEVGAAVRLQAIAELAAGVRLAVGLELGDFLALAGENVRGGDISTRLLRILIEESELQLGFFAKAALSAQAYANLVVTGTALANPITGAQPGFTIAAGAGAGLKAGAGFQVFGTVGVASFSRLVSRSADVVVDETVTRIAQALPDTAADARAALYGLRPGFKIAMRLAFELGEQFAQPGLTHNAAGQEQLSARGLQVALEELQRAICEGAVRAAVEGMQLLLAPVQAARAAWDSCHDERHALADRLESAPPPLADADSLQDWLVIMTRGAELAAAVGPAAPGLLENATLGWAALKIASRVSERVERASAGVSVIGVAPRQVAAAFTGPMSGNVPAGIDATIRATLAANGLNVSGALDYTHLALFLAQRTVVDTLIRSNPALAGFLDDLRGTLAPDVHGLIKLILSNASSFPVGGGAADPVAALTVISNGLRAHVSRQISTTLRDKLEGAFAGNDDLRVYFEEVLVPTLDFALLVISREAIGWATSGRSPKAVTEALSAVLLKLLSRSLVAIADTTLAHVQEELGTVLRRAADEATRPNGLVETLVRNPAVGFAADEVGELVHDALLVAADVFGPLPSDQRTRIRGLLYDVLDPAGATPGDQLLQQLENPGLIPNEAALRELAQELGTLASERFVLFVQGLVMRILARIAEAWQAALAAALAAAEQFIAGVAQAIALIAHRLDEIAASIQALAAKIARAAAGALNNLDDMLDGFSSTAGRSRFVDQMASRVSSSALALLEDNWAYHNLVPAGVRSDVRSRVRSVVRDLLEASPFEEFLDAIGTIHDQFEDLIDDARGLDRNAPLAPQIADLLIARLSALVADRYGTIRIRIAFTVGWNTPAGRISHDFNLGRVRVKVGDIADIVRPLARGFGAFETAVDALADRIREIFDAEAEDAELRDEEAAVRTEHTRLTAIADEQHSGPKEVVIERPVQMQTAGADTRVVIRLEGFGPTALESDEHTPQRVFIVLNGEAVSLASFRVELGQHAAGAVASSIQRQSRDLAHGATLRVPQERSATGARATLGSAVRSPRIVRTAAPTAASKNVRISGSLPRELLTDGLNTLTVVAVAGPGARVSDTVGFLAAPARAAPTLGLRVPAPLGKKGLPQALTTALSRGVMVSKDREKAARTLARQHSAKPIKPLARIVDRSPLLAERAGIPRPSMLPKRGVLQLMQRKERDHK